MGDRRRLLGAKQSRGSDDLEPGFTSFEGLLRSAEAADTLGNTSVQGGTEAEQRERRAETAAVLLFRTVMTLASIGIPYTKQGGMGRDDSTGLV